MTDLIQVMLKEHQHVKAVKYVCAFGLRDKFKPASLLKELLKNSEEASKALCENSDCPIDKKVNLLSCCFIIFMAIFLSLYLLYMIPAQSHKKVGKRVSSIESLVTYKTCALLDIQFRNSLY